MGLFEERAVRYMTDLIRDFDLYSFQAAAAPGNFGVETSGFTDITENNPTSGRGGLGDAQWTGPRRVAFEAWVARNADKNWAYDTYEANYSMLFRELNGPESRALEALRKTTTLEQATEVFMDKFERPGVLALSKRIDWAKKAMAAWQASGKDEIALRDEPRPDTGGVTVLPPAPQIDGLSPAMQQLLQVGLPLILALLQSRVQQLPTTPGTAPQQPDILAELLKALMSPVAPPAPKPVITAVEPPKPVVTTESAAAQKPSVQLSLLALAGSVLGMIIPGAGGEGLVGTPFGMGQAPTTTGTLSVVLPAITGLLGASGVWGSVANMGLSLLGGLLKNRLPK